MQDPLSESKVAEAAQAAAVSHEAMVKAQAALLKESEVRIGSLMREQIKTAFNDVFFVPDGEGRQKKYIDITRIPRLCDDVRDIKTTLWWMSRIASVVGFVILTLIAALIAALRIHIPS
jgi:hypothetical protein